MGKGPVDFANAFRLRPGDAYLTTKEYEERYKIPRTTQCRHRKDGSGPPFVVHNGKVLYPESGIIGWLNSRLINSTAELPQEERLKHYGHLTDARVKAAEKRQLS